MVKYENKSMKSILNRLKNIDSWFWCRYTLNPYQGWKKLFLLSRLSNFVTKIKKIIYQILKN